MNKKHNVKHYPTHPGAEHPPIMTCEIPLEEYESLKRENAELKYEIKRLENVRKVHIESIESMCEGLKLNAKQICKTQRALWLARALALSRFAVDEYLRKYTHCNSRFWNDGFNTFDEACKQMQKAINIAEAKCRAKAEVYK